MKRQLVLEDYGPEQKIIHDTTTNTMVIVEREGAPDWTNKILAIPELLDAAEEILQVLTGNPGELTGIQINNLAQAVKKARGWK